MFSPHEQLASISTENSDLLLLVIPAGLIERQKRCVNDGLGEWGYNHVVMVGENGDIIM